MNRSLLKLATALCLYGCLCVGLSASALAKDRVQGISERVFKVLGVAQEFIDAKDYEAAQATLEEALQRRTTTYERAQLLNVLGYLWYEADELERARKSYREALALEDLPESMLVSLHLTLGQVHLVDEQYTEAERYLTQLLGFEGQNTPNNRVLLAAAYLGDERYREALEPLYSAIGEVEAAGDVPRENWLSMLSSVYYELDDMENMRGVIEKLALLYPREQYLMNLAALHGQLGDEEKQLALAESLLDDGRVSQASQLTMLVNLFLGAGLPHKAAVLLERELEKGTLESNVTHLELLSQAWYMSAELDRAVVPLGTAAELSESGDLYLRLARLHMDAGRWEDAEVAAGAALAKGGLREEGQAWLLRGMADVRLKRFNGARAHFRQAAEFNETEKYAGQWLTYIEAEEARVASTLN
ncbi:MAG: tetratricopeptide repeat protein [Pseudomonadota bacterium]